MVRAQIERFVDKARTDGAQVAYPCSPGVAHDFRARPKGQTSEAALLDLAELTRVHLTEHLA